MSQLRLQADFNGLFGDVLCLSHSGTARDDSGNIVQLSAGMIVIAFDHDVNERGERDDLVASGTVEPSPEWLRCKGSRWVLRIDEAGVRNQSDVVGATSHSSAKGKSS